MNAEEYAKYKSSTQSDPVINVVDLDPGDYTLAYGYTLDRDTFHVYLRDNEIHRVVYTFDGKLIDYVHGSSLDVKLLRASKRVYPDTVDVKFAYLMRDARDDLCFLGNFDFSSSDVAVRAKRGAFKGKIHYELSGE